MSSRPKTSFEFDQEAAIQKISEHARTLNDPADLDELINDIGDARIVMLGEASHGTHEYYTWRTQITQRLIREKDFNFIAVEGDWPDFYRLNRTIKGYQDSELEVKEVLRSFRRWPTWMWANWEILALSEWLYRHNQALEDVDKIGFYGLDVYSLWESIDMIRDYLRQNDPEALDIADEAFYCLEPYRKDEGQSYAQHSRWVPELCEDDVVNLLTELKKRLPRYDSNAEDVFDAEQNGLVVVNAEKYYRAMIHGGPLSWNIRDQHMTETLNRLLKFYGEKSKAIVWAHNTHVGDARATGMADEGMNNIGELARIRYLEEQVYLIGFGSYRGSVIAADSWGANMKEMKVPEAIGKSWESVLHKSETKKQYLLMKDFMQDKLFEDPIAHRAIGVVYHPAFERLGNYVPSIIPKRYDAFIFLDETEAVHPFHIEPNGQLMPQTYPFGL